MNLRVRVLLVLPFWVIPFFARAGSGSGQSELGIGVEKGEVSSNVSEPAKVCERMVESETCAQFRLRRPDLKDQFLKCGAASADGALALAKGCARGLGQAALDYLRIFDPPTMSPSGISFVQYQEACFADLSCRESAFRLGSKVYFRRDPKSDEIQVLNQLKASERAKVPAHYYGVLEQLREMKKRELACLTLGWKPESSDWRDCMREVFPHWNPALRELYAPPGWSEKMQQAFDAIRIKMKELGIELSCLDEPTVAELLCTGAGYVVNPLVVLKVAQALPKAWKVLRATSLANAESKGSALLKIEEKWGRALNDEERQLIQKAHLIGALEKGKDGGEARLGNYTWGQLRRKYDVLKDHFDSDQIRDLMESGAVGVTSAEKLDFRRLQVLQGGALQKFEAAEDQLLRLNEDLLVLKSNFGQYPEFQQLNRQINQVEKKSEELLGKWNSASLDSTREVHAELEWIAKRNQKFQEEIDIWKKRRNVQDWSEIRKDPRAVAPDRVYSVKTDRGDVVKVVFNEKVAREMMWGGADEVRNQAARSFTEAVARGYRTKSANSGLDTISLDGDKFIKINIVGQAIGAYRIYGMEKDGVIYFVNWEHASVHDARFLRRAYDNTERAFEAYLNR